MFVSPYPHLAMWVGFVFAAYAAVANDSIQTLGTFIASNQDKKWWVLWIFIGGVFIATHSYSWLFSDFTGAIDAAGNPIGDGVADGDVSHGRLLAKGFENAPQSFHFLQIAALYIFIDSYPFKNACLYNIHSTYFVCCCTGCSG